MKGQNAQTNAKNKQIKSSLMAESERIHTYKPQTKKNEYGDP